MIHRLCVNTTRGKDHRQKNISNLILWYRNVSLRTSPISSPGATVNSETVLGFG